MKNSNNIISIITVSYNAVKTIEETIKSVIEQSYDNLEYIIIDGKSTDGTLNIIKKYKKYINYWISEPDNGIYDAMNKGVKIATGNYLFFLGADDRILPNVVSNIFNDLLDNKPKLICGNIIYESNLNKRVKSNISKKIYLHNTIHHQSAFYHKELFSDFKYDLNYKITADYELNIIIFLKYRKDMKYINLDIADCNDDGISRINILEAQLEMMEIRNKYFSYIQNLILDFVAMLKMKIHLHLKV